MIFFTSFNNDLGLAGVFLDISNACDNVRQDGLICKLKQKDIKDKLLSFNGLFEKSPTRGSLKWSALSMEKSECKRSTRFNFRTYIVFDLHKRLAKRFTV